MYNIEDTTSRELAQLYGVTLRSMNRILSKLEDHGYIEIVGKKKLSKKGRPSRILRLKLSRS
jgi:transcription initiation factor IIE alpha subunit